MKRNNQKIKKFIKENSSLFWSVKECEKENISDDFLVETILNWGTLKDVRTLFELLGKEKVAEIFYKNISGKRTNYRKKTINLFNIYFAKLSFRNSFKRTRSTSSAIKTFF